MNENINKSLGGKCYEAQIQRDLEREPVIECPVDKRRKCDSFYYNMFKTVLAENDMLRKQIDEYKNLLKCYHEVLSECGIEKENKAYEIKNN